MQEQEDEGAWGSKHLRGRFVRISWLALFGIDMILFIGAAIGTFVPPLRDFARDKKWTFFGAGAGLFALGYIPVLVVTCNRRMRYNTPINFVMLVIHTIICSVALVFICAPVRAIWVIPTFLISLEMYVVFLIIFSYWLDVGKCFPYILSTLLCSAGLIGLYCYLFDALDLEIWVVVTLPVVALIANFAASTASVGIMRKTDELELDYNDYLLGAVFFRIGGDSYIHCCQREVI